MSFIGNVNKKNEARRTERLQPLCRRANAKVYNLKRRKTLVTFVRAAMQR